MGQAGSAQRPNGSKESDTIRAAHKALMAGHHDALSHQRDSGVVNPRDSSATLHESAHPPLGGEEAGTVTPAGFVPRSMASHWYQALVGNVKPVLERCHRSVISTTVARQQDRQTIPQPSSTRSRSLPTAIKDWTSQVYVARPIKGGLSAPLRIPPATRITPDERLAATLQEGVLVQPPRVQPKHPLGDPKKLQLPSAPTWAASQCAQWGLPSSQAPPRGFEMPPPPHQLGGFPPVAASPIRHRLTLQPQYQQQHAAKPLQLLQMQDSSLGFLSRMLSIGPPSSGGGTHMGFQQGEHSSPSGRIPLPFTESASQDATPEDSRPQNGPQLMKIPRRRTLPSTATPALRTGAPSAPLGRFNLPGLNRPRDAIDQVWVAKQEYKALGSLAFQERLELRRLLSCGAQALGAPPAEYILTVLEISVYGSPAAGHLGPGITPPAPVSAPVSDAHHFATARRPDTRRGGQ